MEFKLASAGLWACLFALIATGRRHCSPAVFPRLPLSSAKYDPPVSAVLGGRRLSAACYGPAVMGILTWEWQTDSVCAGIYGPEFYRPILGGNASLVAGAWAASYLGWTRCAHLGRRRGAESLSFFDACGTLLLDRRSNRGIEPAGRSLHVRLIQSVNRSAS